MTWFYRVYGLQLTSTSAIPGLQPIPPVNRIDLEIQLPHPLIPSADFSSIVYSSQETDENNCPLLLIKQRGEATLWQYWDGTTFLVTDHQIWVDWPPAETVNSVAAYLLGPILAFVLRRRGILCLHASVVGIADRAIGIVGQAGMGKSTTAAAFAQLGYAVLSDDVLSLHENNWVEPGYPRLRLWPDAAEHLFGSAVQLARIVDRTPRWAWWDKRYLALDTQFQPTALPLAALFILTKRQPKNPSIEPLAPSQAIISLIANTYATYALDKSMRAREFEQIGRVVTQIPVYRATPHTETRHLSELCQLMVKAVHD